MDKKIAGEIAEDKLKEVISDDKSRVMNLLKESEHEFLRKNGVEYQIRVTAFYENEEKVIRVCVSVDDQRFWSTLLPLCRSDFYAA